MKSPFILFLIGIFLVYLGLTGRLGAVLGAIFEPQNLTPWGQLGDAATGKAPNYTQHGNVSVPQDPYTGTGGIVQ